MTNKRQFFSCGPRFRLTIFGKISGGGGIEISGGNFPPPGNMPRIITERDNLCIRWCDTKHTAALLDRTSLQCTKKHRMIASC